jgi:hypothetical protein
VRTVEPSPHDPATCYVAATRYKLDDTTPYLFVTRDFGATWQAITAGIAPGDYCRVIRADPNCAGVLYAGTESGLYVSLDDGGSWQRWSSDFPVCPVYDLKVKGTDLVIATHGRSAWILDDLTPLYQWADGVGAAAAAGDAPLLFAPRPTVRVLPDFFADWIPQEGKVYGIGLASSAIYVASKTETGHQERKFFDAGKGAPHGALLTYILPADFSAETPVTLDFLDRSGALLRRYTPKPAGYDKLDDKARSLNPGPWISAKPGVNRFLWNLRVEGATKLAGNKTALELNEGPFVLPGSYTARLTVGAGEGAVERCVDFEALVDPRVKVAPEHLAEQNALLLTIRDSVSHAYQAVARLRDVREQVQGWRRRLAANETVLAQADALLKKLDAIGDQILQPGEQKDTYHLTARPRLNEAIASLVPVIASADARPTAAASALVAEYAAALEEQAAAIETTLATDAAALSRLILEQTEGALVL